MGQMHNSKGGCERSRPRQVPATRLRPSVPSMASLAAGPQVRGRPNAMYHRVSPGTPTVGVGIAPAGQVIKGERDVDHRSDQEDHVRAGQPLCQQAGPQPTASRHPFSTATQMVTYPIGTISEQLACRRNRYGLHRTRDIGWVPGRRGHIGQPGGQDLQLTEVGQQDAGLPLSDVFLRAALLGWCQRTDSPIFGLGFVTALLAGGKISGTPRTREPVHAYFTLGRRGSSYPLGEVMPVPPSMSLRRSNWSLARAFMG